MNVPLPYAIMHPLPYCTPLPGYNNHLLIPSCSFSPHLPPFLTLLSLLFSVILLPTNSFPQPLPSLAYFPPCNTIPIPYSHIHLLLCPYPFPSNSNSWPFLYTSNTYPINLFNLYFKQFVMALDGKCEKSDSFTSQSQFCAYEIEEIIIIKNVIWWARAQIWRNFTL